MIKKCIYLVILILIIAGCQGERTSSWRERYRRDPEAYHEALRILRKKAQKDQMYRRFILIEPNLLTQKNENRNRQK